MLAALAVTARHGGWAAVEELLGRLRCRGVAGRWFVLALVLGSVTVVPALVHLFTGGSTDADAVASHLAAVPLHFLIVATVGGGLDEELGWRGVAWPQLQLRMPPVPANLLLGLVWAAWPRGAAWISVIVVLSCSSATWRALGARPSHP